MSTFRLIRGTEVHPAPAAERELDEELLRRHRLPSFARNHSYHRGEHGLGRALRPLQCKFSVINPVTEIAIPRLAALRLRESTPGGAATVALHEPLDAAVHHERLAAGHEIMPGRDILFWTELRYRLVVGGAAVLDPLAAALATPVAGTPIQWFRTTLLVPDADAIRQMDPLAANFYRLVTGRLGRGSPDRYWYLDAWERFHEEGRVIGCICPVFVQLGQTGGAMDGNRAAEPRAPTEDEILFGDVDPQTLSRFPPYSPNFGRRGFVPPGYCLIHYLATVEVAVTGDAARTAA